MIILLLKKMKITKYYISSYQNSSKVKQTKYYARIFFEDGCEMENVRAYTVVHNLKDITSEIYHIPEDIIENKDSVGDIRKKWIFLFAFLQRLERKRLKNC